MSHKWSAESVIAKRIELESDVLVAEFQKSVQHGNVIDQSARLIAEMRFLQKSIEGERFWRDHYEKRANELEELRRSSN